MSQLILKPGKQKSILRYHPWIFSGAVDQVLGEPAPGETIDILDAGRQFLCRAAYSPHSQIRARIWTWDQDEKIDAAFFEKRLRAGINARSLFFQPKGAARLIFGESDRLPGIIVDQFAETLVFQLLSAGAEYWRETLVEICHALTGAVNIYERSDADARKLEGLFDKSGLLFGPRINKPVRFVEEDVVFEVDIEQGQKTGYYLDQRKNRIILRNLASNRDSLDCFCYTGGFTLNLIKGGARSITSVDSSAFALEQAKKHLLINGMDPQSVDWQEKDVFRFLRELRDRNRAFDLIILDPPKFAQNASQVEKAARAYKDINLLALKLLRPGGLLATFSCSGSIEESLFQKIVAGAAVDAKLNAQIIHHFHQSEDHPISLHYPESAYLKGFLVRV